MSVIPALRKWEQEIHEFKFILGYINNSGMGRWLSGQSTCTRVRMRVWMPRTYINAGVVSMTNACNSSLGKQRQGFPEHPWVLLKDCPPQ